MGKQQPFWTFKNLAQNKGELLLYGPISQDSWWGDEVTPKQFSDDLKGLGDISSLDVRINSGGGDVFAAQAIHSLLKAHNAEINIYIDGLAASAATIIAMAGDKVYIPSNAMMMVHNPLLGLFGMYNTEDFQQMTDVLNKVKDSIVAAYQAKTKMSAEELSQMMDAETWLTGAEAVEKGFADELLNAVEVVASLNGKAIISNGLEIDITKFSKRPDLPKQQQPQNTVITKTKEEPEIMDLAKIKNDYPELYQQIKNEGKDEAVTAERNRIKAIDDLAMPGYEEIVNKAKFETGVTAENVAMEMIKQDKQRGTNFLNNTAADAQALNQVKATHTPMDNQESEDDKRGSMAQNIANFANTSRKGRK